MTHELAFRSRLRQWLVGHWHPTWHEYAPGGSTGVPDVSFLVNKANCETGWLELKSTVMNPNNGQIRFDIQPAQHQWMEQHANRVPCWFLCEVNEQSLYLVGGIHHQFLSRRLYHQDLLGVGIHYKYDPTSRSDLIAELTKYTRRNHGEG